VKVLIGTALTQGQREGDHCWCEGELLRSDFICSHLIGVESNRGTTTAIVADNPDMTMDKWAAAIFVSAGRAAKFAARHLLLERFRIAYEDASHLHKIAFQHSVGDVIESYGGELRHRKTRKTYELTVLQKRSVKAIYRVDAESPDDAERLYMLGEATYHDDIDVAQTTGYQIIHVEKVEQRDKERI
jgi:hypothetical protein